MKNYAKEHLLKLKHKATLNKLTQPKRIKFRLALHKSKFLISQAYGKSSDTLQLELIVKSSLKTGLDWAVGG